MQNHLGLHQNIVYFCTLYYTDVYFKFNGKRVI